MLLFTLLGVIGTNDVDVSIAEIEEKRFGVGWRLLGCCFKQRKADAKRCNERPNSPAMGIDATSAHMSAV